MGNLFVAILDFERSLIDNLAIFWNSSYDVSNGVLLILPTKKKDMVELTGCAYLKQKEIKEDIKVYLILNP